MKTPDSESGATGSRRAPTRTTFAASLAMVLFIGAGDRDSRFAGYHDLTTVPVVRGPLRVVVSGTGDIEPWRQTRVVNDCVYTTRILSLIPEGSQVKAGDVVCTLDASELREMLREREVRLIRAEAALHNSKSAESLQEAENERRLAAARADVERAAQALDTYRNGLYPEELKELSGEYTLAREAFEQSREEYDFTSELWSHGYTTNGTLSQAQLELVKAQLKLEQVQGERRILRRFDHPKSLAELRGDVRNARADLNRTALRNERALTQSRISSLSDERKAMIYRSYYNRLQESIDACTMRAPHDGQVIYSNSWRLQSYGRNAIEEGATVRYRQQVFSLPDVRRFKIVAWIHESKIAGIAIDQPVELRFREYPNEVFHGFVHSVADFPALNGSSWTGRVREFRVEVFVDEPPDRIAMLKPRMTADLEILVDRRDELLQVPASAIVGRDRLYYVVVMTSQSPELRRITPGTSNDEFVEVNGGLRKGEAVVVDPDDELVDALIGS